jgi:hypothetical protein
LISDLSQASLWTPHERTVDLQSSITVIYILFGERRR